MQILILGMHRSGTSATSRLVNMMGAYFAPEALALTPARDNPKGFWERRDVLRINDQLLKLQDCQWNKLKNWDFSAAGHRTPELEKQMQRIIQVMDAHRNWFIKDPRLCLTLPAWLGLLESPVALIVYRDPLEIALSLSNRGAISPEQGLALWEIYAAGLLNASLSMPRCFVKHADIISTPVKACETMLQQLTALGAEGLSMPSPQAICDFIDPRLYHARFHAGKPALSPNQEQLCEMLQGHLPQKAPVALPGANPP